MTHAEQLDTLNDKLYAAKTRADAMLAHIERVDRILVLNIEHAAESEGKMTTSAVTSLLATERKMAFQVALAILRETKP